MAPILHKAKIPMITPLSTNPKVTLVGDYIFRACFIDPFQGTVMANFALRNLNAKTAAVLINVSEEYSKGLAKFFIEQFQQKGGKVVCEEKYLRNTTDFDSLLQKTKKLKPDVIFIPGGERDSGFIIKQARNMGIAGTFIGGDGWGPGLYKYGGKFVEDSYYISHWNRAATNLENINFLKMYEQKNKKIPEGEAQVALGYDSVMIFADAVYRSKSLKPTQIRDALANTKNYKGVTGKVTFNKNGDPVKSAIIIKLKNGIPVFVKSIEP